MLANEPPSALAGSTMSEFTPTAQRIALLARPLVFTNGVFDLLHAGHVMCLQEARKLGASLAVGINSDASARRGNKGPGRPFNAEAHRCRVMAALRCVDAVFLFEQDQAAELMRLLRPEVYVKGSDYQVATLAEARLMASWGGRTVIVPRFDGLSSSQLVNRILAAHATAPLHSQ
jgi:rfaE bifunctional protein nucleotidyltransferase chain/domain